MKKIALLFLSLAFCLQARADPALHGTWSATVDGQPLVVVFAADKQGEVNDMPMQWQTLGKLLFIQHPGGQPVGYAYALKDGKLSVSGGDLAGVVVLSRGAPATSSVAPAQAGAPSPNAQDLVGKWCQISTFSANAGGSSRSTCFELRADGSYVYQHEGSMSAQAPGMRGGTASQSSDAGRWHVKGDQLVAQSQRGTVNSYRLEKRNHPKNKRDPMICLNGECYVTFYNRAPW